MLNHKPYSIMFNNYPAGAANDPCAPYNQCDPEPREFDVEVQYVLYREATIDSDVYEYDYDDETGYLGVDYAGDVQSDYEAENKTPVQLLHDHANVLTERLVDLILNYRRHHNGNIPATGRLNHIPQVRNLRNDIAACQDWDETFEPV